MAYYDYYGFRPYVSVAARRAQAARNWRSSRRRAARYRRSRLKAARSPGRSGAKPGATTSNATATTRIGCRADGATCATDRSSIYRSGQAASRRSLAARRCTT